MNKNIELLAPGGDIDSIKAAIAAGADAIYCGLDKFNARNRATNISLEDLPGILHLAHKHDCQIFLTLNIVIVESEIRALILLLNKLVNTSIDGVIVQDLGMLYLLHKYFPTLKVHASTQLTTHNTGQIEFLKKLGVKRINLCRELSLQEISDLTEFSHSYDILIEVFVHGSYCISVSGLCYMSSVWGGTSGNRGRCSQPCRDQYVTTAMGKDFPLNLKDNSAWTDLKALSQAGVDSLKIEGRIKKSHYVYTVVKAWKEHLRNFFQKNRLSSDQSALYSVFNRDFSDAFLKNNITKEIFIDNPRDHSAINLADQNEMTTSGDLDKAKEIVYDTRTEIINHVQAQIAPLSIKKADLILTVSGRQGQALKVSVRTADRTFEVLSTSLLRPSETQSLDQDMLLKRFKAFNETEYTISELDLSHLDKGLGIPFKELTRLKQEILFGLNESRETLTPISLDEFPEEGSAIDKPELSILISTRNDLYLCEQTIASCYFELPQSLTEDLTSYAEMFHAHAKLIPWFPSLLIAEDYTHALRLLEEIDPPYIVTNNTGLALAASQRDIPWMAGPHMNITNSYSLLCLKEHFRCSGAYISNELSQNQIRNIKKPQDFQLNYSIYHPIEMMTQRVCLFQQIGGCDKERMDESCISQCEKYASISSLKDESFFIVKNKDCFHKIYNGVNYLNTEIFNDVPYKFSEYLIDLRDIKTNTVLQSNKEELIHLFLRYIAGDSAATAELHQSIHPTTLSQYKKGI